MAVETFEGVSTDSIIIIIDPQAAGGNRTSMGWLRSLPFLRARGIANYTFPKSWLEYGSSVTFDEVLTGEEPPFEYTAIPSLSFDYQLFDAETTWRDIHAQHICQVTSQEAETKGQSSMTQKLIRAHNEGQIDELFLVVDRPDFYLDSHKTTKPLTERLHDGSELSFEGCVRPYLRTQLDDWYLSGDETLNIWLQQAAVEYTRKIGEEPTRIADLFDFNTVHPAVRTWDFFEFLAADTTREETDHIQATIRPWVEKDITVIRKHILNELQTFDFDAEQVRKFREC